LPLVNSTPSHLRIERRRELSVYPLSEAAESLTTRPPAAQTAGSGSRAGRHRAEANGCWRAS